MAASRTMASWASCSQRASARSRANPSS
jgi:hypothetical protein